MIGDRWSRAGALAAARGAAPWLAAFLAACGLVSLAVSYWSHTVDDAFISFRYARNLVDGLGLVFNEGERVEGYTNLSWVLLMAAGSAAGLELPGFAVAVSIACVAWLVLAMVRFSLEIETVRPLAGLALLGPALLAAHPLFIQHAGNGLETALFTLLLFLFVAAYEDQRRGAGSPWRTGILIGLGYLTRPDAVLWLAVAVAADLVWWLRGRPHFALGGTLRCAAACLLIAGAHESWRLAYYGDWLPNTFHAKAGANWFWGVPMVRELNAATGWLLLLAFLAAPVVVRRRWLLVPWLLTAGYVLYAGRFAGMRYAVPILPLAYLMVQEVLREGLIWSRSRGVLLRRAVPALALALTAVLYVPSALARSRFAVQNRAFWLRVNAGTEHQARCLKRFTEPDDTIAVITAGVFPFYSERRIIDMLGLNDRHIARDGKRNQGSPPGHQRHDVDYVLRRQPRIILAGKDGESWVAAVKEMHRHPGFHESYELTALRCPGRTHHVWVRKDRALALGDAGG